MSLITVESFTSGFILVGISELGDRTQIATFSLTAKYGRPLHVFAGAMLGFLLADGLAALVGNVLLELVPALYLRAASGLVFIAFGLLDLRKKDNDESEVKAGRRPLLASFYMILISEMGDKTQLTTALLVAELDSALGVLLGVLLAMALLSLIAIVIGARLRKVLPMRTLKLVSAVLFVGLGVFTLLQVVGVMPSFLGP